MKSICGKEKIENDAPDILYDESRVVYGIPDAIYYPDNIQDISEIMNIASVKSRPVTIIGGQTGITGGSVPVDGCIAISLKNMNKILRIDTDENSTPVLYFQAGITLAEIDDFLAQPDSCSYDIEGIEYILGRKWFYPPDPTEMSAQLGGTVATNASGSRSFKFGPTRDHIQSISMVLANGETVTITRNIEKFNNGSCSFVTDQGTTIVIPQMNYRSVNLKNASGYFSAQDMDCIDLFIGSEGTLGIFAEIGIHLSPLPSIIAGLTFFPTRSDAFTFADFLRNRQDIAAIEYFDTTALDFITHEKESISLRIPDFPENCRTSVYWEFLENNETPFENLAEEWESVICICGSSFDNTWSGFEKREMEKLKAFRHAVPELINLKISDYKKKCSKIRKVSTDTAVSHNAFPKTFNIFLDIINEQKLHAIIFGHLGDHHIHCNILPHTEKEMEQAMLAYNTMMETTLEYGGTVSAEHGIGKIKVAYLEKMYGKEVIKEMEKIKSLLDPKMRLNPGNLFKQSI